MKNFVASEALPTSGWRRGEGFLRRDVSRLAAVIDRVQSASASILVLRPAKRPAHGHFPAQQRGTAQEFGDRSDATLRKVLSRFAEPNSGPSESSPVASLQPYCEIDLLAASRSVSKLAYEIQPEPNPDWVAHRPALR